MDSQQVYSQPLYDDSQRSPNSSVLDNSESIPLRGGFATSTQTDAGVSQQFHTFHFTSKLCTTGVPFEKQSEPSTYDSSASSSGNQERICNSSSGEESCDQEKAGDKSGITKSSENDEASGQKSKGNSERLISLIFNNNEYMYY